MRQIYMRGCQRWATSSMLDQNSKGTKRLQKYPNHNLVTSISTFHIPKQNNTNSPDE